jgi:hypothetical protein
MNYINVCLHTEENLLDKIFPHFVYLVIYKLTATKKLLKMYMQVFTKAVHNLQLFDISTKNLSIDIVGHRLSVRSQK